MELQRYTKVCSNTHQLPAPIRNWQLIAGVSVLKINFNGESVWTAAKEKHGEESVMTTAKLVGMKRVGDL